MSECVMLSAPPSTTVCVCMYTFERQVSVGLCVQCSYVDNTGKEVLCRLHHLCQLIKELYSCLLIAHLPSGSRIRN